MSDSQSKTTTDEPLSEAAECPECGWIGNRSELINTALGDEECPVCEATVTEWGVCADAQTET